MQNIKLIDLSIIDGYITSLTNDLTIAKKRSQENHENSIEIIRIQAQISAFEKIRYTCSELHNTELCTDPKGLDDQAEIEHENFTAIMTPQSQDFIADFKGLGWNLLDKKTNKKGQLEILRFIPENIEPFSLGEDIGTTAILVSYSSQSTLATKFHIGLANPYGGFLIVNHHELDYLNHEIRHKKASQCTKADTESAIEIVTRNINDIRLAVGNLKEIILTPQEELKFATRALTTRCLIKSETSRFDEEAFFQKYKPEELLVNSSGERSNFTNLWDMLLVVHFNLLNGNYSHYGESYQRRSRVLQQIKETIYVNLDIWKIAENYIRTESKISEARSTLRLTA